MILCFFCQYHDTDVIVSRGGGPAGSDNAKDRYGDK
jgi:hypothetical protein